MILTTCINNNININDFICYVNIDIRNFSMDMVLFIIMDMVNIFANRVKNECNFKFKIKTAIELAFISFLTQNFN